MPLSLGAGKVFHLDGAGTNCETDVLVVLWSLVRGKVKGTLGWWVGSVVSRRAACCSTTLWLEVLLLLWCLCLSLNLGLHLSLDYSHLLLGVRDVVFPHVLHQVCLRSVGPIAHGTVVNLGMLHCVGGQMNLQWGSICVCTMAVVALERFVFVVLPSVGLQVGELCESLLTPRVSTFVGPVSSMDPCVLL